MAEKYLLAPVTSRDLRSLRQSERFDENRGQPFALYAGVRVADLCTAACDTKDQLDADRQRGSILVQQHRMDSRRGFAGADARPWKYH